MTTQEALALLHRECQKRFVKAPRCSLWCPACRMHYSVSPVAHVGWHEKQLTRQAPGDSRGVARASRRFAFWTSMEEFTGMIAFPSPEVCAYQEHMAALNHDAFYNATVWIHQSLSLIRAAGVSVSEVPDVILLPAQIAQFIFTQAEAPTFHEDMTAIYTRMVAEAGVEAAG